MMRVERRLRADHVRPLLRLVGEAHEMRAAGECPRAHLVGGLGQVFGAEVSLYVAAHRPRPGRSLELQESTEQGWSSQRDRDHLYAYIVTNPDPLSEAILSVQPQSRQVFVRRDLIEDRQWYGSELTAEIHRPLRLDDVLCASWRKAADQPIQSLIFKRRWGTTPFGVEERDLLAVFLDECPLFDRVEPMRATVKLAPREAKTLALLQLGHSEKEVAHELGISPSTVHGYVKDLYRKLGVSSRGELLARYPARAPSLLRRLG